MARNDDISSTEKLLDVIRDKKDEAPSPPPLSVQKPKANVFAFSGKRGRTRSMNVGIDAGHEFVRFVKTMRTPDGKWKLLDVKKVAYPFGLVKGSPDYAVFLREELVKFGCSAKDDCSVWLIMSAAEVEVRHFRIPKIAKKQIENAAYWGMRKEFAFDENENIFDFEVQGEVMEQGIPKLAIMGYTVPRKDVETTRRLFAQAGIPLDGMVITPFAVQNIFRTGWLAAAKATVASLFIGNEFSRIDVYSRGNLVMSRGIKTGVRSMVEALMETFNDERRPDPDSATGYKVMTFDEARQSIFALGSEPGACPDWDKAGLTEQEVFQMAVPALERLARQVERTFEHYLTNVSSERIEEIFISSVMNIYRPMLDYLGDQLAVAQEVFDPLDPKLINVPDSFGLTPSERIAFVPALGLALSDNAHTPNILFTYRDKEEAEQVGAINRYIFMGFVAGVVVCALVLGYQFLQMTQKKGEVAKLEAQIAKYVPPVNQAQIKDMLGNMKQRQEVLRGYSERYLGMAVLGELSALTPTGIKLIGLKSPLGYPLVAAPAAAGAAQSQPPAAGAAPGAVKAGEEVVLEGLVMGDPATFESQLFRYKVALDNSPLFRNVTLKKQELEPFRNGRVLHFIMNMQIG